MNEVVVEKRGNDQWPRFLVKDSTDRYWSGKGWVQDSHALLFHEEHEALRTALELTMDTKLRLLTATFSVIVEGKEPVTVEELRDYLSRNCQVTLEVEKFNGVKLTVDIEWNTLVEA